MEDLTEQDVYRDGGPVSLPIERDPGSETDEAAIRVVCQCGIELIRIQNAPVEINCCIDVECPECGWADRIIGRPKESD